MTRKFGRKWRAAVCAGTAAGALALAGVVPAATASAATAKKPSGTPVVFHVDVSETGAGSHLGATEAKAYQGLASQVNASGGIDGHPMKVTLANNNSTPTTSVSIASKWISQGVKFLFVGSLTAVDKPVDALATSSGPFIYDMSPGDTTDKTPTVFDAGLSTAGAAKAYLTYLKGEGLTKIAIMTGTTSTGTDGYQNFQTALATKKLNLSGLTVTTHQTFTPTAPSVTTQMAAIKATKPQAIIVWVTGSPAGTALKGMASLGMLTVPTVLGNGNASYTELTALKTVLPKKLYFQGGPLYYAPKTLPKGGVRTAVANFDKIVTSYHGHVGDPWGLGYDPGLLMVDTLKKVGVNASATKILKYMEHLHKVPGVFGYYTTTPKTHRGTSYTSIRIDSFNGTSFVPVSGPGGVVKKK